MRLLALFMGVLFALQMTYQPIAATAAASGITFDQSAGAQGSVACNKVGALLVAEGIAVMSGTSVEISAKGKDGKTDHQLQGKLLKAELVGGVLNATAFFTEGPGLSALDAEGCSERVDLTDGTSIAGAISDVTTESLTAGGRSVPMSSVKAIHSGRAFKIAVKTGSAASKMNPAPTCIHLGAVKHPKTKTAKSGPLHGHPIITTVAVVGVACGVACAIALPIAIPLSHHHSNKFAAINLLAAQRLGLFPFNSSSNSSSGYY
ncbi:MAG TPA: hypothetical protein V6C72_02630 [Chroococcales cyanobacterium]